MEINEQDGKREDCNKSSGLWHVSGAGLDEIVRGADSPVSAAIKAAGQYLARTGKPFYASESIIYVRAVSDMWTEFNANQLAQRMVNFEAK